VPFGNKYKLKLFNDDPLEVGDLYNPTPILIKRQHDDMELIQVMKN
jgi:hypothetical protein